MLDGIGDGKWITADNIHEAEGFEVPAHIMMFDENGELIPSDTDENGHSGNYQN